MLTYEEQIESGGELFKRCEELEEKLTAMTAAKDKAVRALKRTKELARLEEGDDTERDWLEGLTKLISELEEVK